MQGRYEVERAWNIKRYQSKLKRKRKRGHFVFINTETESFSHLMDDNNAQLHLTHAQFAPVGGKTDSKDKGVTKASRKKTHIATNW